MNFQNCLFLLITIVVAVNGQVKLPQCSMSDVLALNKNRLTRKQSTELTSAEDKVSGLLEKSLSVDIGAPATACAEDKEKPFQAVSLNQPACHPCKAYRQQLTSFYGNCYVILPKYQRIYYVKCAGKCPCWCRANGKDCRPTRWQPSWFFSFCFSAHGAFNKGINYRPFSLPQDCTCN